MPDLLDISHWLWLLLFCFGVYVILFMVRKLLEGFIHVLPTNYYWTEVALPTLPVVIGLLLCLKYPFPMEVSGWSMRLIMGACGGYASGWSYRIVKAVISKATGVDVDSQLEAVKKPEETK